MLSINSYACKLPRPRHRGKNSGLAYGLALVTCFRLWHFGLARGQNIGLNLEAKVEYSSAGPAHNIVIGLGLDVLATASNPEAEVEAKRLISRPSRDKSFSFEAKDKRSRPSLPEAVADTEGRQGGHAPPPTSPWRVAEGERTSA